MSVILGMVVLYPESFITGGVPMIGVSGLLPSHFLAPMVAAGAGLFMLARYKYFQPGPLDVAVLVFFGYLAARNIGTPMLLRSIKYLCFGLGPFYLATGIKSRGYPYTIYLIWVLTALTAVTVLYGLLEYVIQYNIIIMSKPPALPGDSRSLTFTGI
ncbi:MAG: hypothetical protein ACYCXF_09130 [Thermoleophilia bacterium]